MVLSRVLIIAVVLQILVTLTYLVRPIPVPDAVRGAINSYMDPVLSQGWSVFAPDPVSYSTWLEVRATTQTGATTPWFDVSACDIGSAVLHHPVPNRRYLTSFQLVKRYRAARDDLTRAAQPAVQQDGSPSARATTIASKGASTSNTAAFRTSDTAMTEFASQVAHARFGTAGRVQIRIIDTHFIPYSERGDPTAKERTETWTSGWSPSMGGSAGAASTAALYAPAGGCTLQTDGGPR